MGNNKSKIICGMILGLAALALIQAETVMAQQACPTVNGTADLKEGDGKSGKAQYWINGFPGKSASCAYTLQLCINGNAPEIGSKAFITTAGGQKLQSSDNILNCSKGWSHFFDGSVAGAQEIMVAIDGGYNLNVRFVGQPQLRSR